jgi:hypothetical protein
MYLVPCQCCRSEFPTRWSWFICNTCHYRVCALCLDKHAGPYSSGGFKCSQCAFGLMKPSSTS